MRRRSLTAAILLAVGMLVVLAVGLIVRPGAACHAAAPRHVHLQLAAAVDGGTDPPQNVVFYVLNPSGHRVWFDAIGSGADGPAGVKAAVKFMIADGFTLAVASRDCGWKANPCVLEWAGPS